MKFLKSIILFVILIHGILTAQYVLIPMDLTQNDHLKSYGIAYWVLENGVNVEWLLNYRGGSFLIQLFPGLESECLIRGVTMEMLSNSATNQIYATIEQENMERILLKKRPKLPYIPHPTNNPGMMLSHLPSPMQK